MTCDDRGARMSGSNSGSPTHCVTLGKLLHLSGFQLSHLQIAGNNSIVFAGPYRPGSHVCKVNECCLEHGRTRIQEVASLLVTGEEMSRENVSTRSVSLSSICSVISTCLKPCNMLGTEQQTKIPSDRSSNQGSHNQADLNQYYSNGKRVTASRDCSCEAVFFMSCFIFFGNPQLL